LEKLKTPMVIVIKTTRSHLFFDEGVYKENGVKNVVVTGSFCNWSQDMGEKKWQLKKENNGIWTKKIYNPNFEMIKTNTPFKFRINDGKWLDTSRPMLAMPMEAI
jgi:hypothetical protein